MSGDARQDVDPGTGVRLQIEVGRRDVEGVLHSESERGLAQRRRVQAQEQVVHDRVADQHHLQHLISLGFPLEAEVGQQVVQGAADGGSQLGFATRVHHHVGDPAHEVLAEPDLRVHGSCCGQYGAGCQVAEVAGDRRGAHVHGHAQGTVPQARPDGYHAVAIPDSRCHRARSIGRPVGQAVGHPVVESEASEAPLVGQGVEQSAVRTVPDGFGWRGDLDQAEDQNRVQCQVAQVHILADDLPMDLALGRDVDHQVAGYSGGTTQPSGFRQGPTAPIVLLDSSAGRYVVLHDGDAVLSKLTEGGRHLAAPADPAASADRVEIHPQPTGGVQQGGTGGERSP